MRIRFAVCAGVVCTFAWIPCAAQMTSSATPMMLPTVDGSKNADAVPDDVALQHFLASLIQQPAETSQQVHRRAQHLSRLGLSVADTATLIDHLGLLGPQLLGVDDDIRELSAQKSADATQLDALRERRRVVLEGSSQSLMGRLSAAGRSAVLSYLRQYVKPRILIFKN